MGIGVICPNALLRLISPDTISHLLAVASQISATVLAIVFSVILLAAELISGFSPDMIDHVFRKHTYIYMLAFTVAVLMSLLLPVFKESFSTHMYVALSLFSLVLTSGCLAYLLLFIMKVKKWLEIEDFCAGLKNKAEKRIQKATDEREVKELDTLNDLALNLHARKNYANLSYPIKALGELVAFATKVKKVNIAEDIVDKVANSVATMLRDIGSAGMVLAEFGKFGRFVTKETSQTVGQRVKEVLGQYIEEVLKGSDSVAIRVTYELGGLGEYFVEELSGEWAIWVIKSLKEYFKSYVDEKRIKLALQINGSIWWTAKIALDKAMRIEDFKKVRKRGIVALKSNFDVAIQKGLFSVASDASTKIQLMQKRTMEKRFDEDFVFYAIRSIALRYLQLGRGEFKEVIGGLTAAGGDAAQKGLRGTVKAVLNTLFGVASDRSPDNDPELLKHAVWALRTVALEAAKHGLHKEAIIGRDFLEQVS